MRLFLYYCVHSFKNQIKKLFKTWIFIFIICCGLIGGLIGLGVAKLEDVAPGNEPDIEYNEETDVPVIPDIEDEPEFDFSEHPEYLELIAAGISLAVLMFFILSADKSGGKIFLPADVSMLFSSPMKPQSVLLFRLITKLGLVLFMCVYFLIEVPMLREMGLPLKGILLMYVVVFICIVYGQILQAILYIKCAESSKLKKLISPVCYSVIGMILVLYLAYWKNSGLGNLEAAAALFSGGLLRFVPIWGWIKGFYGAMLVSDIAYGFVFLALSLAGIAACFFILMRMKADFYEEAMKKAEETASLLRDAQENSSLVFRKKKKDRSEKIKRDGFSRGSGASVYFWKSVYNRKRFAKFGYFTKTCITYLMAAIVSSVFISVVLESSNLGFVALVLGVFVFYRAMGNPLERDAATPYFVLIPDSMWKKLFFSIAGSTLDCMLDLLPGMIAASVILKANPLQIPAWMLFIGSVDFYSSAVGTFIALSVPVSAGKTLKTIVQVMFIYFGIIPDAALIAVGITFNHTAVAVAGAAIINMVLGLVFLSISPNFIAPKGGRYYNRQAPLGKEMLKKAKGAFSKTGFTVALLLVLSTVIQLGLVSLIEYFEINLAEHEFMFWLLTFVPIYLIGMPVSYLVIRKLDKRSLEKHSLRIRDIVAAFFACQFLMICGNIIGQLLGGFIYDLAGVKPVDATSVLMNQTSMFWQLLIVVIIGPVMEEIFCRKLIIDRLSVYGERKAVFMSALIFGLFHGNIYQYFYAFFIGLIFGYVYLRSGRLRYSIILHMLFNFFGSVVPQLVLSHIDFEILDSFDYAAHTDMEFLHMLIDSGYVVYAIYVLWIVVSVLIGIVCFFSNVFNLEFKEAPVEIQKGKAFAVCYANFGMIALTVVSVGLVVFSMLSVL